MKKYTILALTLVLTAALFTGCRDRNGNTATSTPTIMPTVEMPTIATTETPTEASTTPAPQTHPTTETGGDMNGATDATETTDTTDGNDAARNRGRRVPGVY